MRKHIVIIGGGFGGLYAARGLAGKDVDVTLIDKRNFHLFQPLLYQVATGGLSPGDIASPIRAVLADAPNIRVMQATLEEVNADARYVTADKRRFEYDALIVATGVRHHYFGQDHWERHAGGLKTIEDALRLRKRIMNAFERAEWAQSKEERCAWQRFVIVGGGPTGVELAGALAELAYQTIVRDFRKIDPLQTEIHLVEAAPDLLSAFPENLTYKARKALEKLKVHVHLSSRVTYLDDRCVRIQSEDTTRKLRARTVIWAAGVKASGVSALLQQGAGAVTDNIGRVMVDDHCRLTTQPDIYVIGDLAHFKADDGRPLPGVAPVAMQQGRYVARFLLSKETKPFRYVDKGSLAVIGRKSAIARIGSLNMSGWPAWLVWIFVHIAYLIEYDSKLKVMLQWAWNFFTRKRGARLITDI
ncbi:MAG: NAD(P)/FAD-dependent oxidoreductase [Calditrichaeota bacterium]|nr:MAG: NAD(P)/FAD-dependent oxidoreductase [Calditrichota bacterium]